MAFAITTLLNNYDRVGRTRNRVGRQVVGRVGNNSLNRAISPRPARKVDVVGN